MIISETAIRRPVMTVMVVCALVVFGVISYLRIGLDLFPDVEFPIVTVTTVLEGADPETVESEVTDVIEEAVNTISGIKRMRSESSEGVSQVFIEFELERDLDVAAQDVRDKVATIRRDLSDEIDAPLVEKLDLDAAPILAIAVSGDKPIRELTDFADNVLKVQLEGINGVGSIKIVGGRDREVRIWLEAEKLRGYNLTVQDVVDSLREQNVEVPGGRVETGEKEFVVKTKGELERVGEFDELVVAFRGGSPIKIKDIGYAEDGLEDGRSLSRLDGVRAVSLLVRRQSGTNMLAVAQTVKKELAKIVEYMPAEYTIVIAQDLSVFVKDSFRDVQSHLIMGACLAIAVILLFLRNWRSTAIGAVTIPSSIISTFAFVHAMGFTLNNMTMLALSISVGMVIDDAVCMLENSYRHMEEGKARKDAAIAGCREIGFAVIATSLAVLAVFVPVAYMKGLVGRFFYEFGITVSFAVIVSTVMALTLTPMLCSQFLKVPKSPGRIFVLLEKIFEAMEAVYRRMLAAALRHRALVVLLAVVIFMMSIGMTGLVEKEFLPPEDSSRFNVVVEAPLGSSLKRTGGFLEEIEGRIRRVPHVANLFTTIGGGTQEKVHEGIILVKLTDKSLRTLRQHEIMGLVRDQLRGFDDLKISVQEISEIGGGGFRSQPIQFNIRGASLEKLDEIARAIMKKAGEAGGIVDIDSTFETGKPEVSVHIDRARAADLGVSVESIADAVQALIGGQDVTQFEEFGERYDVRVRLVEEDRDEPEDIDKLAVRNESGELIDFRNLVHVEQGTGPVQIDRQSRQRQVTVLANLSVGKALGVAEKEIRDIARDPEVGIPPDYDTDFTGFVEYMGESFRNIGFSLALGLVLIYMILAAQFESFIHPLTIMFSVPLSVVGAIGMLALTGRTLNIFSMIGMIMLMGLVTKNAILLVDYTNTLRSQGMERNEAIMRAGPVRLRPIFMTAFSTIFGMLPIFAGIGAGAESRAPMATCVVGGLLTSTFLTLLVVPVVYSLFDDIAHLRRK